MTRRELFTVFTEERGISTRTRKRSVYVHCPYIKADVEFSPATDVDPNPGPVSQNAEDSVVKISRPCGEDSIMD